MFGRAYTSGHTMHAGIWYAYVPNIQSSICCLPEFLCFFLGHHTTTHWGKYREKNVGGSSRRRICFSLFPYSQSNITINILRRSTDNKTRRIKIVCGSDFYCVKVAERFSPIFFCSIWIWKIGIIVHFRREMAFLRLVNNHNTHTHSLVRNMEI